MKCVSENTKIKLKFNGKIINTTIGNFYSKVKTKNSTILIDEKFIDIVFLKNYEIETDTGFKPIGKIMKTVLYEEWLLKLEDGYELLCADDHIVFDENMEEIFVKNLKINDLVQTENGLKKVLKCYNTEIEENMYDVEVDSCNHRYYSNGILSHNTTCSASFILWKSFFFNDHTTLLTGNVESAAIEIMDRIKFSYENMEKFNWLRPGVTKYDRKTIHFDNNSRIICKATTPTAGRGLSVSLLYCLHGKTCITVRDKETKIVKNISLEDLYKEMEDYDYLEIDVDNSTIFDLS